MTVRELVLRLSETNADAEVMIAETLVSWPLREVVESTVTVEDRAIAVVVLR